jgi:hypothetical protein
MCSSPPAVEREVRARPHRHAGFGGGGSEVARGERRRQLRPQVKTAAGDREAQVGTRLAQRGHEPVAPQATAAAQHGQVRLEPPRADELGHDHGRPMNGPRRETPAAAGDGGS